LDGVKSFKICFKTWMDSFCYLLGSSVFGYALSAVGPGIDNCDVCDKVGILHHCFCNPLPDVGAGPSSYVAGFGSFLGGVCVVVRVGDVWMKGYGSE
jgi:hypothetical protein